LQETIAQVRQDLQLPGLKWFVRQQPPTDEESVNQIDVVAALEKAAAADSHLIHIKAFDLPPQQQKLVITAEGIVELGELLARHYLQQR
ncbi:MAG: sialate O-acetylesterase, partial [Pirellulales bacterium]|nr:sialate O-acetylesterase [Pirellulales bacterium]